MLNYYFLIALIVFSSNTVQVNLTLWLWLLYNDNNCFFYFINYEMIIITNDAVM